MPHRATVEQALAAWRAATGRQDATTKYSPEWEAARMDAVAAQAVYRAAVQAVDRQDKLTPVPPSVDEALDLVPTG